MKSLEKDKPVLKAIMGVGVQPPENERFNQEVLERLPQMNPVFEEPASPKNTFPGILLIVLSFLVVLSTWMGAFLGNLEKIVDVGLSRFIGNITDSITGLIFYSPLFVMIFLVIFLLYRFDRFLNHKMSVH